MAAEAAFKQAKLQLQYLHNGNQREDGKWQALQICMFIAFRVALALEF